MSNQPNPPHHPTDQKSKARPHGAPADQQATIVRNLAEPPLPEFLQNARRNAVVQGAPRPKTPRETVVPVLDDQNLAPQEAPGLSPLELDELEREITRAQMRPRRKLAPEFMPPPPPLRPRARVSGDSITAVLVRLSLVAAFAGFGALLFMGKIPLPAGLKSGAIEPLKRIGSLIRPSGPAPAPLAAAPAPQPELPKLIVEGADAGNGDEIGLGVKMTGPIEGVIAIVSGIAAGTTLSKGQPWGETGWFVPAADLAQTRLRPPAGFSGTMQYTVALKMPDAKIADRQVLRLQWSASTPSQPASFSRKLEPDELAIILKRGQALLETGDISGAQLLLQRAAEAGDASAAMSLASTYDPIALEDLGVRGFKPDVNKARFWYEKARELGSKEAPRRLESLASQGR